ncbi:heme-binding protein 2-like [Hydractinia symbiolongicarpus]|uniref:heme-binding protein 2-like n=1 Tax=Hydractinia symbiolongicarpus TaxID=13093 RepID=UPI00254B6FFA|nr:heme-binding protein 2-like [Hydractinia symbiolongicarpus]
MDKLAYVYFTPLYKVIRQYIDGYNVKKIKYNLTVPVLLRVAFQKNLVNLHSHMWIPPHVFPFLSKPLNPKLHFVHQRNYCVFVRSFGGRIHSYDVELKKQVDILKSDLDKAGLAYPQDFFWFAGYDAPWTVHGRHNEVWLRVVKKKKFNY